MFKLQSKRILFWLIYSFVAVTIILFSLEGIVRLLKLAPILPKLPIRYVNDSFLVFKPRPLSTGRSTTEEFDVVFSTNSLGFRDTEHRFIKPDGVYRILGLGDSFTQGAGVNFEETYLYVLEEMFNARPGSHPAIEIIKAGISGYFPELERLLLQHYGVKFQPDLILVGFTPNDVIESFYGIGAKTVTDDGYLKTYEAARLGKIVSWLFVHSHVGRIVLDRYVAYKVLKDSDMEWNEIWYANDNSQKAWQNIEREYKKMVEIVRQRGAEIIFVHIPQQPKRKTRDWGNKPFLYPNLRLLKFCSENELFMIDTLPALRQALANDVLYHRKDGHCNAKGNRVIAETIYSKLNKNHVVP